MAQKADSTASGASASPQGASLSPACSALKNKYDECFNRWYSEKFLRGERTLECTELFEAYQKCLWSAIREKKIEHLVDEARRENPFPTDPSKDPAASSSSSRS